MVTFPLPLRPISEIACLFSLGIVFTFPGKFVPLSLHPYAIVVCLLLCLLAWWENANANSPLTWSIVLMLGWLPVNLWVSINPAISWQAVGYFIYGITLYFTCSQWLATRQATRTIVWMLLLASIFLATISPFIVVLKPFRLFQLPLYHYLANLKLDIGETLHLNVLAGVIVLLLPLWGSFALCQRNNELPGPRWIYLISLLYLTAIVIIAQSRGAYLAIVISFLVLFLLHWPNRFLIWGLLVSVCTGIYWWHFPYQILNFISADDSLQGWHERVEIWQQSINALYIFTFTGIGIGTFIDVIPLFFPLRANIANYPHAHNLLLQIALDLGIPGFIAYLSLLFNLIVMLSVTLRKADRRTLVYTLGLGLAGSLTAMLVHGLLDAVLWGTKLSFLPWILFALISQLFYQVQQIEQ